MSIKIALAGNPNCGKTTLFNLLTGSNQFVGNWPGVTVEKKEGKLKNNEDVIIVDLPGVYSLSPYTLEEVVARKFLVDERPDAIINLVDGTNLERNLYLTTQLTELGIPVVIAINMMDVVEKRGDKINVEILSKKLGCNVVEISALKGTGINETVDFAIQAAKTQHRAPIHRYSGAVEHALAHIEEATIHNMNTPQQRWYAVKIFERDEQVLSTLNIDKNVLNHIEMDIKMAEAELDDDAESIIINERYLYIESVVKECFKRKRRNKITTSDKIDKVVTNRFLALPIFAVVMFLMYYISVSTVGTWATDWANDGVFGEGWSLFGMFIPSVPQLVEALLNTLNCADWLQSLILDGIIKGVGSVLGFVPQMIVLFIFLAFLEACGYMSRVAFMMDKLFRKFGLSGKSFIPMLIGSGCSVPGIMASRTIENEHDRRMTIITTSFIPCSAKLPVIALIAGNLFNDAWWVAPSAYFVGVVAVVVSGIILKKSKLFSGDVAPFVLELPIYHMPTFSNVMRSMWERVSSFIKKAGTVILVSSIIIWLGSSFGIMNGKFTFSLEMSLGNSVLGMIGNMLKVLFVPLGFGSAETAVATIMGLIAKEEIVSVLNILEFNGFNQLSGYSFLVFNLLCAPCFAAVGAIKREMNSAKWTLFAIGYQCTLAYAVSLIIYQFGKLFIGTPNFLGVICAVIVLVAIVFMLMKPFKKYEK
ncbi:MAG: ferrous iron transport protein B [Clostridia bacterium]|nr:ferrous iron transport protein B [Clostridia bacterium]